MNDGVKHPEERFPKQALAFRGSDEVTHSAFVAEQTINFIEQHREQSWLCVAGFYSPHSPWVAPQRFLDLYDPAKLSLPAFPPDVETQRIGMGATEEELRTARHGYYAMISEVDEYVGRIVARLEALGLADDTIIIFTSDHGEWLGEHHRYGKSYPGHDPVSRVPFLIRWPNGIRNPGRRVSDIVEAVDVVPTLLDCAALQVPARLQGVSLYQALLGKGKVGRGAALMEQTLKNRSWKSIRTERFRYIRESDGKESLYDIDSPHGEYADVSGEPAYREALEAHRLRLLDRLIDRERPLPRIWAY